MEIYFPFFNRYFYTLSSWSLWTTICSKILSSRNQPRKEKKTDVRITLEHKGDKAISNQTTTTIYYKEAGVTKDQLKEMIDKYDEEYKDVKGFTHSAEYKDDYMVEKTTLNYEKADLDQLIEKKLVATQKDKKVDYISYKSTFDMMKQSGFKEVKNGKFEELK